MKAIDGERVSSVCETLGIHVCKELIAHHHDHHHDYELLWIARLACTAPLPPSWQVVSVERAFQAEFSNPLLNMVQVHAFFKNSITGIQQIHHPSQQYFQTLVNHHIHHVCRTLQDSSNITAEYVCMCMCMYICVCIICVCVYVYIYMCVYIVYVYMCMYICVCIYVYVYIMCMYILCVCIYVYVYMCICVCVYVYVYMCMYICV